jgi:hypothetical protein
LVELFLSQRNDDIAEMVPDLYGLCCSRRCEGE